MNNQMFINNMNLFNPMMNPNCNNNQLQQQFLQQQQMLEQQILQQQQMYQQLIEQQQMNNMKKEKERKEYFTVIFRYDHEKPIMIQCTIHDKVSDIIEKYKNMAGNSTNTQKFIYNAQALNPNLTAAEANLVDNSNIFVVEAAGIRGG